MTIPKIVAHELRVAGYGWRIVTDDSLPVSCFRVLNAKGGGVEYNAETGEFQTFREPSPAPTKRSFPLRGIVRHVDR